MTEDKFHRTREMIEKILSGFDELGSYGLVLVDDEVRVHYYLQAENVRYPAGKGTITIKGRVFPRYAGPVRQLVEEKVFAYLGRNAQVKMIKVTKEEFESLDIEFPTMQSKTLGLRRAKSNKSNTRRPQ